MKDNSPELSLKHTEIYEGDIVRLYTYYDEEESELNESTIHKVEYPDPHSKHTKFGVSIFSTAFIAGSFHQGFISRFPKTMLRFFFYVQLF